MSVSLIGRSTTSMVTASRLGMRSSRITLTRRNSSPCPKRRCVCVWLYTCDTVCMVCVCTIPSLPDRALGWFPLGLGLVMEDEPAELSCAVIICVALAE